MCTKLRSPSIQPKLARYGHPNVARLGGNADLAEMATIPCAGVTTYKGIKETEAKAGEGIAISGIGGSGTSQFNMRRRWVSMSRHST